MIVVLLVVVLVLELLLKKKKIKNEYGKILVKYILISCLVSGILELTVFQFRHYESLFFKEEQKLDYVIGSGLNCRDYLCKVVDSDNAFIEVSNLDIEVNNIYLDIEGEEVLSFNYEVYYSDEANKIPFDAGMRKYSSLVQMSHYSRINASGKINYLKIDLGKIKDIAFYINKLAINKEVPFLINNLRIVIVFLGVLFVLLVNPKSKLQEIKYNFKKSKIVTRMLVIGLFLSFGMLAVFYNSDYGIISLSASYQYKNLARALAKGKFVLDLKVDEKLLELSNPYDRYYRALQLDEGHYAYWDYAFFKGRYYSYFGIVPCLLTYLPYYLVTGRDLANHVAITIAILFLIIAVFKLVANLIDRYFKNISYIYYCLLCIFFLMVIGLAGFAGHSDFYNLPLIFSVVFALLSLHFYLLATRDEALNKKYLFLGSLSLALILGCRPQVLVVAIFPIIILWDYVFKKRELFSKKSVKETVCLVLPLVVVAFFIMYYNYARFGNILDFGANYNLTTNDMTRRGFKFDRIFLGIYYFLFSNAKIVPVFPFIEASKVVTNYLGRTIYEDMYGGFFWSNIVCVLSLFFFKFKDIIKDKKLYQICQVIPLAVLIIVVFDTQVAGILPRYLADFSFLLGLSTVIIILALLDRKLLSKEFQNVLVFFLVLSIGKNFLTYFLTHNFNNNLMFLQIYDYIYYTFMFWL